jgi:alpha-tubulin suppressor-like RCC1 family protein
MSFVGDCPKVGPTMVRRWDRRFVTGRLLVAVAAAVVLPEVGSARSSGTAEVENSVPPVFSFVEGVRDVGSLERRSGTWRLCLQIDDGPPAPTETLFISLGDLALSAPLVHGRFRGNLGHGPLRMHADVRTRAGRTIARIRGRVNDHGGGMFGASTLDECSRQGYWNGTVHRLSAVSISVGDSNYEGVCAVVGRSDARSGAGPIAGLDVYSVSLTGVALFPGTAVAGPILQVLPEGGRRPWNGRIRGHVVALGEVPEVGIRERDLAVRTLEPLSAEALDVGGGIAEADGVRRVDVSGTSLYQVLFDSAVPEARPNEPIILVGRSDGAEMVLRLDPGLEPDRAAVEAIEMDIHAIEVRPDGVVWTWGNNTFGQLGNSTRRTFGAPRPIVADSAFRSVSAGSYFSCAVDRLGGLWRWGRWEVFIEESPGVFVGRLSNPLIPTAVGGFPSLVQVSAGSYHILGIDRHGNVWAVGENRSGQLGDGTAISRSHLPLRVEGLPRVIQVAGGNDFSVALDDSGRVWQWGGRTPGDDMDSALPRLVTGLPIVRRVSAGLAVAALGTDGSVWSWGSNAYGQLGDGSQTDRVQPGQVSGLPPMETLSMGDFHCAAVGSDGTVWAWGLNVAGQLGDGTSIDRTLPVRVRDLRRVRAISAGGLTTVAMDEDQRVWTWGSALRGGAVGRSNGWDGVYPILERRLPDRVYPPWSSGPLPPDLFRLVR